MNARRPAVLYAALALACSVVVGAAPPPGGPAAGALTVFQIVHKRDWKAFHGVIAVHPKVQKELDAASPEEFAAGVKKGFEAEPNAEMVAKVFDGMSNLAVGTAKVKGTKADVPTSCTITLNGQTLKFRGVAHMVRVKGKWKLDLTGTPNVEQATAKAIADLLGKPATAK